MPRIGGAQPGGGRPKNPTRRDILIARFEQEADLVYGKLFEALKAERAIVSQRDGIIGHEPDWSTVLKAATEIDDRVNGRPRQSTEITGGLSIMDIAFDDEAAE